MMDLPTKQKSKGSSVSRIKQLFEIKRPPKSPPSTLPKTKPSKSQDETDVGKERMFVRNNRNRISSRKNKYRREQPKEPTENMEHKVPQLCQQFSMIGLDSMYPRESSFSNSDLFPSRSRSDEHIDKILTNSKTAIEELKQLYENVEVKRRNIHEKKDKEVREKKIRSFADAMDEGETEEYRRNVVQEIDQHIAHMRDDGFLDELGNIVPIEDGENEDSDIYSPEESVFLSMMRHNSSSDDSLGTSRKSDDTDRTLVYEPSDHEEFYDEVKRLKEVYTSKDSCTKNVTEEYKPSHNTEEATEDLIEGMFIKVDVVSNTFSELDDEFTESLGDDLENGLNIVEAYNDDERELIEVQVLVDRRVVNLETFNSMTKELEEGLQQSDMVFYQNTDKIYELIGECEDEAIVKKSSVEEPIYASVEYIEPDEENGDHNMVVYAPDSNRSTIYSTTSRDSSVFDEDDEGIEVSRPKSENEYVNVRRETFCDNKGIIRIERVAHPERPVERNSSVEAANSSLERSDSAASPRKLEYIVDEIKSTERKYVDDLTKVVTVFKPYIEKHTPEYLIPTQGYLFGNVEKILRRQRKFLAALVECGDDVNKVVNCFLEHERLFEIYPNYFRNKPKADTVLRDFAPIIKSMQEHFEERLNFSAYLLTPVQRLGKYILFLENIEKELKKLDMPIGSTQMALDVVKSEMSKGNDYVAIDSIQNSPISKLDYGSFKMQEHFSINKPRRVETMVFLFTNVIVLTTMEPGNHEVFNYYDSIKMEDLRIATFENFTIHLTDFTKSKRKNNSSRYTYVLEAKTEKVWNSWRETIENILWQQLYKVKEMTLTSTTTPRYKTNKYKKRNKSTGSSIFYIDCIDIK